MEYIGALVGVAIIIVVGLIVSSMQRKKLVKNYHWTPELFKEQSDPVSHPSMSLRDWFAGQALAGWIDQRHGVQDGAEWVYRMADAEGAYRMADAMLVAREVVDKTIGKLM